MDLMKEIAGYEVLDILGYGASSTIYAVRDPKDGQIYAIKRVIRRTPSDQRFIDQALTEHEVASKVKHPALRRSYKIIRRRKLVRTSELLVLMQMVDGVTLEARRPDNLLQTVRLFQIVAEGLTAMHQANFLHCDIKPNNIILTGDHDGKIIDFGQACPVGTTKNRIQGTPDYIAPEQVLRLALTPQTDVFNLGATMYWVLTEHHVPTLIPRKSDQTAVAKPKTEFKPPIERNPQVPASLNALVVSCVETELKDRPRTMQDVVNRLELIEAQLMRSHDGSRPGDNGRASA